MVALSTNFELPAAVVTAQRTQESIVTTRAGATIPAVADGRAKPELHTASIDPTAKIFTDSFIPVPGGVVIPFRKAGGGLLGGGYVLAFAGEYNAATNAALKTMLGPTTPVKVLFGENLLDQGKVGTRFNERAGKGGMAKDIAPLENAVGIVTCKAPVSGPAECFTDADLATIQAANEATFKELNEFKGAVVVPIEMRPKNLPETPADCGLLFPTNLGRGVAKLDTGAPKCYEWLSQQIKNLSSGFKDSALILKSDSRHPSNSQGLLSRLFGLVLNPSAHINN